MNQRNLGASVRQRLLDKAHAEKRPFQELLQYYAMERFLYRLTQSSHAKSFVLVLLCYKNWRKQQGHLGRERARWVAI